MKRFTAFSLAAALTIPLGLAACAVYEPAPAYPAYAYAPPPAYGYYPAYPRSSSTFVFRGDFGGGDRGGRHRHW